METLSLYRIDDERPGSLVRLTWRGPRLGLLTRYAPWLAGLAAISVLAAVVYAFFGPSIGKAMTQGGDAWSDLVPLGFILLIGGVMLYNFCAFVVKAFQGRGTWTELTWDRTEDRFTAKFDGVAFSKVRSLQVPLSKVVSCEWRLGPESGAPLQLQLKVQIADSGLPIEFPLEIEELDARVAACDFLLRVGRVLRHSHYLVHLADARVALVSTYQNPEDAYEESDDDEDEESEESGDDESAATSDRKRADYPTFERPQKPAKKTQPRSSSPSTWAIGKVLPISHSPVESGALHGAKAPDLSGMKKRSFHVEQFIRDLPHAQLEDWQPGVRVEVAREGWTSSAKWFLSTVVGLVAAFVLGGPLFFLSHAVARPYEASRVETGLAALVVGTLAVRLYLLAVMRPRSVVIDWRQRMMQWSEGRERAEVSLGDIDRVTVGVPQRARDRDPVFSAFGSGTKYEVQLRTRDGAYTLVESKIMTPTETESLNMLLPFAQALAESLRVPCRVLPSQPGLASSRLRWPPRAVRYGVAALVVLIALGVGQRTVRSQMQSQNEEAARARLVAAGVSVERIDSRPAPGGQVVRDVWRVSFPEGIDDTKLLELLPDIEQAGRIDLVLKGTLITNFGSNRLGPLRNLVAIDLSDTRITTDGVDQFYRLHAIEHLNLSRTFVSDNGLSIIAMNNTLKVLEADGTLITDACMLNLRICSSLRYLSILDTQITEEGRHTIQGALPELQLSAPPVAGSSGASSPPSSKTPPPPAQ